MKKMRDLGPEREDSNTWLRQWFEEQERRNLDRLEEGAKSITQLVTGLYGVLFAVLSLSDTPAYLQRPTVRWLGSLGVAAFFVALLAALVALYPWSNSYQQDNLTEMQGAYRAMVRRKVGGLRVALWAFVFGAGFLGGLLVAVLWKL